MSMSVGVEMGVPGVIIAASDALAAAAAIDRPPMMEVGGVYRVQRMWGWGLDGRTKGRVLDRKRDALSEERSIVD